MLSDIFQHWRYFIPRFIGYGTILGGLFGGLTYPIIGILFGAPWGFFGGLLLGVLAGIGVPVYNRYFAPDDSEHYQSQLTFGAGLLATLVMALPLLFIYSLVAGLVTSYIMHQYAENPGQSGEKRKHSVDAYQKRDKVFTHVANAMMSKARYFILIATGLVAFGLSANDIYFGTDISRLVFINIVVIVAGLLYGFLVAAMIAAVNGLFTVMVNRLFFDPDMSKSQYKARIVPLIGILTLFLSMIVTAGIGAPFAAIAGAFGASKYADWYYALDEEEKAKRSANNLQEKEANETEYDTSQEDADEKMLLRR